MSDSELFRFTLRVIGYFRLVIWPFLYIPDWVAYDRHFPSTSVPPTIFRHSFVTPVLPEALSVVFPLHLIQCCNHFNSCIGRLTSSMLIYARTIQTVFCQRLRSRTFHVHYYIFMYYFMYLLVLFSLYSRYYHRSP